MFKNMKLAKQIGIGFGIVIVLLLVVSFFAYQGLNKAGNGFTQYRGMARDTNLTGLLQTDMLMVRMNVKDFLITDSKKDYQQYQEYAAQMREYLDEARKEIQNPERAKKVTFIHESVDEYQKDFDQVVEITYKSNDLISNQLDPNGLAMRTELTEIMKTAYQDQDPDA
ncbi:MAG: MCP four helix bundle domain-containing protein, partial [Desulfuromusa sp.]